MADQDVSDIMINTHKMVYIEKRGKLLLSDITFTSEKHLLNTIQKIVSLVGRRIDETSPHGRCAHAGRLALQRHHPAVGAGWQLGLNS